MPISADQAKSICDDVVQFFRGAGSTNIVYTSASKQFFNPVFRTLIVGVTDGTSLKHTNTHAIGSDVSSVLVNAFSVEIPSGVRSSAV
jgi:hypothetical protein